MAGDINTTTQYNLGGSRVLSAGGTGNLFAGVGAGTANTSGWSNSFFGSHAGNANTTGWSNSLFGYAAGYSNTTGYHNSFFGYYAGISNTTGLYNSFFGKEAGYNNTTGQGNTFAGLEAGKLNTTGGDNAFFGTFAGNSNTTGAINTMIGRGANPTAGNLTNATAVGANAQVGCSNCLVLGSINGLNGATATVSVGIGTSAPADRLHVGGDIRIGTGSTGCVKDADGTVIAGTCSSDARLKQAITSFPATLDKLIHLRPVHFYWRAGEYKEKAFGTSRSFGLIAQEVEEVLPELVTTDEQGFKAINYSKLPLLMLQAIKELKADNDELKADNNTLRQQLKQQEERLRRLEAAMSKVTGKN